MIQLTEGQRAAGRWVKAQRGRLGLDQEIVAARAGISPTSLRNLEREKSWPRASTLNKIEEALSLGRGDITEYAYWYDHELANYPNMEEELRMVRKVLARMERRRRAAGE